MISPEVLRRYSFFSFLDDESIRKMAMLAEEVEFGAGDSIFVTGDQADFLYLLTEGDVNLCYYVVDSTVSHKSKEFSVGEVNPGEPFGLSSLLGKKAFTAKAGTKNGCKCIQLDAKNTLKLAEEYPQMGYRLMQQLAKAAFERLDHVRVQFVAATN